MIISRQSYLDCTIRIRQQGNVHNDTPFPLITLAPDLNLKRNPPTSDKIQRKPEAFQQPIQPVYKYLFWQMQEQITLLCVIL